MESILEDIATKLTPEQRFLFAFIFSVILIAALLGNLATIWLALQRKHRLFYKCCVISLSVSDVLMAISTCSYSLSMFSHPWINWTMGEFLCKMIPFIQTVAVLSNSFTLSSIAMDRYQGVVNAMQSRWNPNLYTCIGVTATIWTIATLASIPMFFEYYLEPMYVLNYNKETNSVTSYTIVDFCAVGSKESIGIYMALVFALIFLPLLLTFLILYGMIGSFIWTRRPVLSKETAETAPGRFREVGERRTSGSGVEGFRGVQTETTSGAAVTSTTTSLVPQSTPNPVETNTMPSRSPMVSHQPDKSRTTQAERRKKRILKIIFALMVTFFVTRLPIWSYNLARHYISLMDRVWWTLQYSLSVLSLLGTVLNPYLYGFLQEGSGRGNPSALHQLRKAVTCGRFRMAHSHPEANRDPNKPHTQRQQRKKPWSIT